MSIMASLPVYIQSKGVRWSKVGLLAMLPVSGMSLVVILKPDGA